MLEFPPASRTSQHAPGGGCAGGTLSLWNLSSLRTRNCTAVLGPREATPAPDEAASSSLWGPDLCGACCPEYHLHIVALLALPDTQVLQGPRCPRCPGSFRCSGSLLPTAPLALPSACLFLVILTVLVSSEPHESWVGPGENPDRCRGVGRTAVGLRKPHSLIFRL